MEQINSISFNQDASCVAIGTTTGYKIFSCNPFAKRYTKTFKSMAVVEMLGVTSLLVLVGMGEDKEMSPRRLRVQNTKTQCTICEFTFPTTIKCVRLNMERMIVVLEERIYVYETATMQLLHTIETQANGDGVVAFSPSNENNFLAYPSFVATQRPEGLAELMEVTEESGGSPSAGAGAGAHGAPSSAATPTAVARLGDVTIFDARTLQPYCVIEAHKAALAAMALSNDGLLLATASVKGTIIRVFSVTDGAKLFQFRRGTYNTKVHSLRFSNDNKFLVASSATGTVHIFRLVTESSDLEESELLANNSAEAQVDDTIGGSSPVLDTSRRSMGRVIRKQSQNLSKTAVDKMGEYLPKNVTSVLKPARHFASLKLSECKYSAAAIVELKGENLVLHGLENLSLDRASSGQWAQVVIVTDKGIFMSYAMDTENGGDCVLLSQYSLLDGE